MSCAHLIITRFNLHYPNSKPPTDEWLAHRLTLFQAFCYASLRGQTCQNFHWLVLFDRRTPAAFREQITRLTEWKNFVPCYIDGFDYDAIMTHLSSYITADTTHLLTTTIDNDDAIAADFVETIQAEVRDQSFELINFQHGYRLNRATGKLYDVAIDTNPFISLIEDIQDEKSFLSIIGCLPHSTLSMRFARSIREINTRPLWLQVVHEHNLAPTTIIGRQRVPRTHLDKFTISPLPAKHESAVLIRIDQIKATIERALLNLIPERLKTYIRNQ